jgi:ADP-ribosylglycohydrolase
MNNPVLDALLGMAVGDALGLPFYLTSRDELKNHKITGLVGFGYHNLPPGTWSDNVSLALAMAQVLADDYDINLIAQAFVNWLNDKHWAAAEEFAPIFQNSITVKAIKRLAQGESPFRSGINSDFVDNSSLHRILPLAFYLIDKPIELRYILTKENTEITHANPLSTLINFYYLEFIRKLLLGNNAMSAYFDLQETLPIFFKRMNIDPELTEYFWRLIYRNIWDYPEQEIFSTQEAISTLEAALWSIFQTNSFIEAVLTAVNLGGDTAALGAVTGSIAGIIYSSNNIPKDWVDGLAKKDQIQKLADRIYAKYFHNIKIPY